MTSKQSYASEAYFDMALETIPSGNPMWSGVDEQGPLFNQRFSSVHDDDTNPLPDAGAGDNLCTAGSQDSDIDLNNITPSLPAPIMFPQARAGPPVRGLDAGLYEFAVLINGANTSKKKFLWSTKLNRLYVDAECDFPLMFSWAAGAPRPAFVRATTVFRDDEHSQYPVETCVNHKSILMKKSLPQCQLSNVLHSSRDAGQGVQYCGGGGEWYSAVVMFDGDLRTHAYRFVCKNSCTGGINRRAIAIVFTLEDYTGCVYGRQEISVRVCACPRRDMRNDERDAAPGKRRCADPPPTEHRTKKVKIEVTEVDDDKIVVLPEIKVRGVSTAITTLEMVREFTAQHKRLSTDPQVVEEDARMIAYLDANINELRASK